MAIDEVWGTDLLDRSGRHKFFSGKNLLRFIYTVRKSNSEELKKAIFKNIVDNHGKPTTQPVWWLEPFTSVIEVMDKQNTVLKESLKRLSCSVARAEAIMARNNKVIIRNSYLFEISRILFTIFTCVFRFKCFSVPEPAK